MPTKIEWCDETINPIVGCTKISPACDNCYAEVMARRLSGIKHTSIKYNGLLTNGKWNGNVYFDENELRKPEKWSKPKRIFITSMGDLFHENVKQSWLVDVLLMVKKNPQHTFIMLTKRPQNMLEFFTNSAINPFHELLENLWLGVTAENQTEADKRIPFLLQIPAKVHFVSCEPLLSNINLIKYLPVKAGNRQYNRPEQLDWVIMGGESGRNPRIPNMYTFINIHNQCCYSGTPLFFKGYGGRKKSGRYLMGLEYNEFPA